MIYNSIYEIKNKYNLLYDDKIELYDDIIFKLFNNKIAIFELNLEDSNILNIIGLYFQYHEKNYERMKLYYEMAIDQYKNSFAMLNYGIYYYYIEINYDIAKLFFLDAIDCNNSFGYIYMAKYYIDTENNILTAKQKLLIACDKFNNSYAMLFLAKIYIENEKNHLLMKKYLDSAIVLNNDKAMMFYADYYESIENYLLMKKYCEQASKYNNFNALIKLAHYYDSFESNENLVLHYYKMAIDLGSIYAMFYFARYYYDNKKYNEMKNYYNLLIDKSKYYKNINLYDNIYKFINNVSNKKNIFIHCIIISMINLGLYYANYENNFELKQKYINMALDFNSFYALLYLKKKYQEKPYKLYDMLINCNNNNDEFIVEEIQFLKKNIFVVVGIFFKTLFFCC